MNTNKIDVDYTIFDFSLHIEEFVREANCSYMDAIVEHCVRNNIEMETAATMLNETIVAHLQDEAEKLNMIEKDNSAKLEFE